MESHQVITISNPGTSIAYWRWINKVEDYDVCKRWLSIDKMKGLLLPNETVQVKFTIKIDNITANGLNSGKELLDDVLVLRLENSFDIFMPVTAIYERSCIGMSLEQLVFAVEPVRSIPLPAHVPRSERLLDNGLTAESVATQVLLFTQKSNNLHLPKELWRLVDALWTGNALKERDLFMKPGNDQEVNVIREALDCGKEFTVACTPHSFVQCLKEFLIALPSPVLPYDLYPLVSINLRVIHYLRVRSVFLLLIIYI